MRTIPETPRWEPVKEIEVDPEPYGTLSGEFNAAAGHLANRTAFLRDAAILQWANDPATTSGLEYGYLGGVALAPDGKPVAVANGTIRVPDNAVSYIERSYAGLVASNTSAFTRTAIPLAVVTAAAGAINAIVDWRPLHGPYSYFPVRIEEQGVVDLRYTCGDIRRYGAACDGGTDDTVPIRRAVLSVIALGGGTVRVPAGTTVGYVKVPFTHAPVVIEGEGLDVTWIKQPPTTRRIVGDAAMTGGSPVLTSVRAAFTTQDVGATVWVQDAFRESGGLVGEIEAVMDDAHARLSQSADVTVSGKTARIGIARNVIEVNDCYRGNSALAMYGCWVRHLTVDGNRASVPAPADAGDDLVNHGVIFTNVSRGGMQNVRAVRCHNTGIDLVIDSNWNDVNALVGLDTTADGCGNPRTGMPNVDINSSSYNTIVVKTIGGQSAGFRLLDNCYANDVTLVVRQPASYGVILQNQPGNVCRNNTLRGTILETQAEFGLGVGLGCVENTIDVMIAYSGGTVDGNTFVCRRAAGGIQVGRQGLSLAQMPQRNRIRATIAYCGGQGALIQSANGDYDLTLISNSMFGGRAYGLELNGSFNTVRATFHDPSDTQSGVVIRVAAGDLGAAPTENAIGLVRANPTHPYDDLTTGSSNRLIGDGTARSARAVRVVSANAAVSSDDGALLADTSHAAVEITLPAGVPIGREFVVKLIAGVNEVIVRPERGMIDGAPTKSWKTLNASFHFLFDGAGYRVI